MYICGLGMLTGVGDSPESVHNAVSAGIDCFDNSGYVTEAHVPVRMALVPEDALPELNLDIPFCGSYSRWDKHLLQLAHPAIAQAAQNIQSDAPIPLLLASPEHLPQWPHHLPNGFLSALSQQSGIEFCPHQSRILHLGRAGTIEAADIAYRLLTETPAENVLIAAVDSYQRSNLLKGLLSEGRVSGAGVMDGFTPGEGAGCILVSCNPEHALATDQYRLRLGLPSAGHESGHLYSENPYLGEGLSAAVSKTLKAHTGVKISKVYSSMNGERFWSKELGVSLTRNHRYLREGGPDIEHPADCFGDLGAASGAVLVGLSVQGLIEQNTLSAHLVCCSSDQTYRSAITIFTESIETIQQEAES